MVIPGNTKTSEVQMIAISNDMALSRGKRKVCRKMRKSMGIAGLKRGSVAILKDPVETHK
jgi:hypothetical protein